MAKVKVTLARSIARALYKHRATVRALGLTRIGSSRIHEETPQIQGMLRQVGYLLSCDRLAGEKSE